MSARVRKFIGSIGIMAFLGAYVIAAVNIGERLPDHWAAQLAFFGLVGIAWG